VNKKCRKQHGHRRRDWVAKPHGQTGCGIQWGIGPRMKYRELIETSHFVKSQWSSMPEKSITRRKSLPWYKKCGENADYEHSTARMNTRVEWVWVRIARESKRQSVVSYTQGYQPQKQEPRNDATGVSPRNKKEQ